MAALPYSPAETPPFAIAGIGASAGGITALQEFFAAIPATQDLAFVVLQHRLPNDRSRLSSLFARWTPMPVRDAVAGDRVEPGHVYLASPTQTLTMEGGRFVAAPRRDDTSHPGNFTIDAFLESLAADRGPRAIAVILSGTGDDGAAGVVRVKQAGGTVLAQDPITASHAGMPSAAIATGAVDHVMPPKSLARELVACASPAGAASPNVGHWDEAGPALEAITAVLQERTGLDLGAYKTAPLLWRIQRRMEGRRVPTFREYALLLQDDPAEVESLVDVIRIHVTEFFRDEEVWDTLEQVVIPQLVAEAGGAALRAWTAACATGQEAYSLAIVLAEQAAATGRGADFRVFATDVSPDMVARAGRGVYPAPEMKGVSPQRLQRFFYSVDGGYRVGGELRGKMIFAPQDLLADPPFSDLDLVTCRNLLIYLDAGGARRALRLLHSALRIGGHLVLGHSESLPPELREGFADVSTRCRIYRKTHALAGIAEEFPRRPSRLSRLAREERPRADDAADWPDALRVSHEELDASREELEALNEELRSSNDQLNRVNLSLNEANAELRAKVDELQTQSDVLSSGSVMAIFLDESLRVRWFTSAMTRLFPLQAADVGRPLTDLAPRFDLPAFGDDIDAVMRTGELREAELRTGDGRWYQCSIRPFRAGAAPVAGAGVAITFDDVTDRRERSEEALRASEERYRTLVERRGE